MNYLPYYDNCTYSLKDVPPTPLTQIVSDEFGTKVPAAISEEIRNSLVVKRVENADCINPVHQLHLMRGFYVDEFNNTIICILSFP